MRNNSGLPYLIRFGWNLPPMPWWDVWVGGWVVVGQRATPPTFQNSSSRAIRRQAGASQAPTASIDAYGQCKDLPSITMNSSLHNAASSAKPCTLHSGMAYPRLPSNAVPFVTKWLMQIARRNTCCCQASSLASQLPKAEELKSQPRQRVAATQCCNNPVQELTNRFDGSHGWHCLRHAACDGNSMAVGCRRALRPAKHGSHGKGVCWCVLQITRFHKRDALPNNGAATATK